MQLFSNIDEGDDGEDDDDDGDDGGDDGGGEIVESRVEAGALSLSLSYYHVTVSQHYATHLTILLQSVTMLQLQHEYEDNVLHQWHR